MIKFIKILLLLNITLYSYSENETRAPIDDLEVGVINSESVVEFTQDSQNIKIIKGEELEGDIPGEMYASPLIESEISGEGELQISYPESTYKTQIAIERIVYGDIEFSLVLPLVRSLITNKEIVIEGFLVEAKEPKLQSNIFVNVKSPSNNIVTVQLLDDGLGVDEFPNDGIYTSTYIPEEQGLYMFEGIAEIEQNSEIFIRKNIKFKESYEQSINIINSYLDVSFNTCIESIDQVVEFESFDDYKVNLISSLNKGSNNITSSISEVFETGRHRIKLNYSKEDILQLVDGHVDSEISTGGIFSSREKTEFEDGKNIGVYSISADEDKIFDQSFSFSDIVLCREEIEKVGGLNFEKNATNGFDMSFLVYVSERDEYTITFKAYDKDRTLLKVFSIKRTLDVGETEILFELPYPDIEGKEGPFIIDSLIIYSEDESLFHDYVGTTEIEKTTSMLVNLINGDVYLGENSVFKISKEKEVSIGGNLILRQDASVLGDISVKGDVDLFDRAIFDGTLTYEGVLTEGSRSKVTETINMDVNIDENYSDIHTSLGEESKVIEGKDIVILPGDYLDLEILNSSKVKLISGIYNFDVITIGYGVILEIDDLDGPVILNVNSEINIGDRVNFNVSHNSLLLNTNIKSDLQLSQNSTFSFDLFSPHSNIAVGSRTRIYANSIVSKSLTLESNSALIIR